MSEAFPFLHTQGWARQVDFFAQGQHLPLLQQVADMRAMGKTIFPAQRDIFQAFAHTAWDEVRVLIMGQDPYHGAGQAHGLAFSVPENTKVPPSLRNILAEVARTAAGAIPKVAGAGASATPSKNPIISERGQAADSSATPSVLVGPCAALPPPPSPCLIRWAKQGVLLLNSVLTVEEGKAHSHAGLGWQECTLAVVRALAARQKPLAALLWGNAAKDYSPLFTAANAEHLVLRAAHPSPLSAYRGFHCCGHFAAVNAWLAERGDTAIKW